MSDSGSKFTGEQHVAPPLAPLSITDILRDADVLLELMGKEPLGVVAELANTLTISAHEAGALEIEEAARNLASVSPYYPAGTVFLVVVDPGVGTSRRGIVAEVGEWRFVAPDNGVLTAVFQESAPKKVVELTEEAQERGSLALVASGAVSDDGIIDPRDTRTVLGMCLSVIDNQPITGTRGYGVFRM